MHAASNIIVMGLHNLYAESHKITWKITNAGKRHFGQWSSIGQWNMVNADTAKRTCHSVRIIRVFIRLVTPVSYYVFLGSFFRRQRPLCVRRRVGRKRKKARACYISITQREPLWRRDCFGVREDRLGLGWSARGLRGRDKGRIASKSGCSYQAGSSI